MRFSAVLHVAALRALFQPFFCWATKMHPFSPRGDFADNARLLRIAAIAAVVGALSTVTAYLLLLLIHLFTNLFFFQTLSVQMLSPSGNTLGLWVILVPVMGGLLIGLLARFGSEQIRGHGIP